MSRFPSVTVTRRSPLGGGGPPKVLKPGELFTQVDTTGAVVVWAGDARGVPQPFTGGPTPQADATVSLQKPNNPVDGQLWYDQASQTLQLYSALAQAWQDVFDDAALLAHDGSRPVTGDIDFDGNEIDNVVLDAGNF